MRRVILTGATGAVGTALIDELTNLGIEVLVFVREGSKREQNIKTHPLVRKKVCSLSQLSEVENDTGKEYDVFYHFAWEGSAGDSRDDMYMQNLNVKYSLDAVGAAKRFGCKLFIGAGSQAEYGRVEGKLTEDTPTFPEMGYGYAKLCAGQMTRDFARQMGVGHIWVRLLSVYGPYDGNQSMVMSTICKLRDGIVPEFTLGEQKWDYLYSGDAARAFRLLGEKGRDGAIYVLGSGVARPLADYINDIREIVNPDCAVALGKIPYSDRQVMYLCGDVSRIQKDIGWNRGMDFKEGIRRTYESVQGCGR